MREGWLRQAWYDSRPSAAYAPQLIVVDDDSQRGGLAYRRQLGSILDELKLSQVVEVLESTTSNAHKLEALQGRKFDLIWNDAEWTPEWISRWWRKLSPSGGLLVLHNTHGFVRSGKVWARADMRRMLDKIVGREAYEMLTLSEPHKAYQGSVTTIRKVGPAVRPAFLSHRWGFGEKPLLDEGGEDEMAAAGARPISEPDLLRLLAEPHRKNDRGIGRPLTVGAPLFRLPKNVLRSIIGEEYALTDSTADSQGDGKSKAALVQRAMNVLLQEVGERRSARKPLDFLFYSKFDN
jgi:hypothetical protein